MKKIKVYRLEHKESKLGPFTHANQIPEVLNKGLNSSIDVIKDIDELIEVKNILKKFPKAIFGFVSEEKCRMFIKDNSILVKHGFIITQYNVEPLYVSDDGQVIFLF